MDDDEKERDRKLQYLSGEYPDIGSLKIREILNESNWNTDEAESALKTYNTKKRPLKTLKKTSNKKKRRRKDDGDEETNIDSDEATYNTKVFDSDDDSDAEISNELTGDKKAVLDFMQNGKMPELLLMHLCSQKRAQAIIDARPFESWRQTVEKFQTSKYLDTELLNSAQCLLATRSVVEALMKKCLRLSGNLFIYLVIYLSLYLIFNYCRQHGKSSSGRLSHDPDAAVVHNRGSHPGSLSNGGSQLARSYALSKRQRYSRG